VLRVINSRPDTGLQARATAKLADVEAKIADLGIIRDTLRTAIAAGCDDLITCSQNPSCPIPFSGLAEERPTSDSCC
jgi:MerR family mercuric resistance operon transcriptional regulator